MDKALHGQIEVMFARLDRQSAAEALPAPNTLSSLLASHCDATSPTLVVAAKPRDLMLFATAAVEMWLRAVHSFLISASLTRASPIWSSVAGYYSSHYSIRAFAHLFGVFHLHKKKRLIQIERQGNGFVFRIDKKHGYDREHTFYWRYLSAHPELSNDPFFYPNREDIPDSDGSHRNKASYADHLDAFPVFRPLDAEYLEVRIQKIAAIEFSDVPVPSADRFPDIETVQILAYHRVVKFRQVVDDAVGPRHRFWKIQRTPSWCPRSMTFGVVEPVYAALYTRKP